MDFESLKKELLYVPSPMEFLGMLLSVAAGVFIYWLLFREPAPKPPADPKPIVRDTAPKPPGAGTQQSATESKSDASRNGVNASSAGAGGSSAATVGQSSKQGKTASDSTPTEVVDAKTTTTESKRDVASTTDFAAAATTPSASASASESAETQAQSATTPSTTPTKCLFAPDVSARSLAPVYSGPELRMDAWQLAEFDGSDAKKPIYVAVKGELFDVSSARDLYAVDCVSHVLAGRDATLALAKQHLDARFVFEPRKPTEQQPSTHFGSLNALLSTLKSFAEHRSLEDAYRIFTVCFPRVGVFVYGRDQHSSVPAVASVSDAQTTTTSATTTAPASAATAAELGKQLHTAIEARDIEQIRSLLARGASVNEPCARTSMSPLHKAVEQSDIECVRLLLNAKADTHARASLYDHETPLDMAARFAFDEAIALLKQ